MNRIDTPDAARQLRRALEEFTQSRVDELKLGKVRPLPGGGMTRDIEAGIGGKSRSFSAVEVGGQVSIIDKRLGLDPGHAHELIGRAETAGVHAKATGWPERQAAANAHSAGYARRR